MPSQMATDAAKDRLTRQDAFEAWLRTACFQKPTDEAYDLAKCAWDAALQSAQPAPETRQDGDLEATLRDLRHVVRYVAVAANTCPSAPVGVVMAEAMAGVPEPAGKPCPQSMFARTGNPCRPECFPNPDSKNNGCPTAAPADMVIRDDQILALAIDGGIYDCINDPYTMADGTYSLDVDLIRFARKLQAALTPPAEAE